MTPHLGVRDANPTSKRYWMFCQQLVVWRKELHKVYDFVPKFSDEQKIEMQQFWVDQFTNTFPNGTGLPEWALRYYRKYHPIPGISFDSGSDSDDCSSDVEEIITDDIPNINNDSPNEQENVEVNDIPVVSRINERFYQDPVDRMRNLGPELQEIPPEKLSLPDIDIIANAEGENFFS